MTDMQFSGETPVQTVLMYVFAINNLGVALAYGYIATHVVPRLPLRRWTFLAGTAFFALCAMTHIEHLLHTFVLIPEPLHFTWHSQLIHLAQVIAAWAFGIGFGLDVTVLFRNKFLTTVVNRQLEREDQIEEWKQGESERRSSTP